MKQKEDIEDQKIIIVSDINSSKQEIIPYGLNLAKHVHTEVYIIHMLDGRVQQGIPSRYADSQSITPEPKLIYDKIIKREIEQANNNLDKRF